MGNIRRSRGYSFEHGLVERLNKTDDWQARRLGGSSTGLPDLVATNNMEGILLAIECKSTASDSAYVPQDQLGRCMTVCRMFSYYKETHVILAFKFMNKKRIVKKGEKLYEARKLQYYFKNADRIMNAFMGVPNQRLPIIRCDYNGETHTIIEKQIGFITLPEYEIF